jgi:glycosyltransferase 2 family protein
MDYRYLSIGFMLYFFCYILRTIRLTIIFDQGRLFDWFQYAGIFQIINRIAPFRLGEIASPILMKSFFKIDYSESIIKIIIIRIFDLILLFILFLFCMSFIDFIDPLIIIFGLLIFILILLFIYNNKTSFYQSFFKITVKVFSIINYKISQKIENEFSKPLIDRSLFIKLFIITFFEKLFLFSSIVFSAYSLGFNFGIDKILPAISMSSFTDLLPINSIGNFGTYELGWVAVLNYFGFSLQESAESALLSHFLLFNFTLIIGIVCIIIKFLNNENKSYKTKD